MCEIISSQHNELVLSRCFNRKCLTPSIFTIKLYLSEKSIIYDLQATLNQNEEQRLYNCTINYHGMYA